MDFRLKLGKTEVSNIDLRSNVLNNLSNPEKIAIMDLFEIRKDLCKRLNKKEYQKLHQKLFQTAKSKLGESHPTFTKNKNIYKSQNNLYHALDNLYQNGEKL